jgi:hypothetical protein
VGRIIENSRLFNDTDSLVKKPSPTCLESDGVVPKRYFDPGRRDDPRGSFLSWNRSARCELTRNGPTWTRRFEHAGRNVLPASPTRNNLSHWQSGDIDMSSHDGQNRPVSRKLTWSVGSGPDTCGNSASFFSVPFLVYKNLCYKNL